MGDEEVDVLPDTTVAKLTLEAIRENIAKRHEQIVHLKSQNAACLRLTSEQALELQAVDESLNAFTASRSTLQRLHSERMDRRRGRVAKVGKEYAKAAGQASMFKSAARRQSTFHLQRERLDAHFNREGHQTQNDREISRHPAGVLMLCPKPILLSDEEPETQDIGTSIANPYVCDSWPFEPNVLAARTPKEGSMEGVREETEEDLQKEARRLPDLSALPGRFDDDDSNDDDDMGPSGTSRSY